MNHVDPKEFIERMIKNGYWKEDMEPIKCEFCNGDNLEDKDIIYEDLGTYVVTEYKRVCTDCNEVVGYWAYGYWQLY